MQNKYTKNQGDNELRQFDAEDMEHSMFIGMTEEGESVYSHNFDDDLRALEFLEVMVAGYRNIMLSKIIRRSMN